MCEKLDKLGLKEVGMDGFWDTTGTITSGQVDDKDYLMHTEPDPNVKPDASKICVLETGFGCMGGTCFRCGEKIFLRETRVYPTDTPV